LHIADFKTIQQYNHEKIIETHPYRIAHPPEHGCTDGAIVARRYTAICQNSKYLIPCGEPIVFPVYAAKQQQIVRILSVFVFPPLRHVHNVVTIAGYFCRKS